MKYSSDTIGNQSRDLPACTVMPKPNATPTAAYKEELNQFARSNVQVNNAFLCYKEWITRRSFPCDKASLNFW